MWGSCFSLGSRRQVPASSSSAASSATHSLTHTGAVHRASWASCGARGRRWGHGCLSRGRRSIHRASWASCGARDRRWGRGCLSRGRRSTQSLLDELRRAWPPLGPRLPFAWQAQYTDLHGRAAARVAAAGAAAAFRVAGAVHRVSWTSCGARGRRWCRGCLSRGKRSTQSLLDELRRVWLPAGAAAAFRGAGAVHRASWASCGARGCRWGRGCLSRGRRSTQSLGRAAARVAAAGAAAAFAWQGPLIIHPSSRTTYHISLITSHLPFSQLTHHLSHVTHHSPLITTPHPLVTVSSHLITSQLITAPLLKPHSSQLHCSSQLITAPLLTLPLLITSHRSTSHHNSSPLITAPLIITSHHSFTSHTSLITSQLLITSQPITAPLLTPSFTHPL